ncbi:MAG: type II toxin-antitoxin system HicA family toxin [Myxococcota bacterium]|jgi:hypothetical protein|nr:type II toxin-antitoxin system HicA family toxin [Myxococcota bacterium]
MANRRQRDVEAGLRKKGFEQRTNDHQFFVYYRASDHKKTSIRTKTSHGGKDLGPSLLSLMARQCHVSQDQFLELVDCPLDQTEYEVLLRAAGLDV